MKRDWAGGEEWVEDPLTAPFRGHERDVGAILRADRPIGGLLATRRNHCPPALLQDV
jgi:hypothetical protein